MLVPPYRSTLANHPDVGPLLPAFVGRLPAQVRALRDALARDDPGALRQLAHQLKGNGKTYGFDDISDRARALEQALDGNVGDVAPYVNDLAAYIENVEGFGQQRGP
jgi:HPt (histidine-containing phosphotransfer) domain-containing protein